MFSTNILHYKMFGIKSIVTLAAFLITLDPSSSVAHFRRLKRIKHRTRSAAAGIRRIATGCYPAHREGSDYTEDSLVSSIKTITSTESCSDATLDCINGQRTISTPQTFNYQCVKGANSAFCSMLGFEPAGVHGSIAWNELFACEVCMFCLLALCENLMFNCIKLHSCSSHHIDLCVCTFICSGYCNVSAVKCTKAVV